MENVNSRRLGCDRNLASDAAENGDGFRKYNDSITGFSAAAIRNGLTSWETV
jgi:hypothetical protein